VILPLLVFPALRLVIPLPGGILVEEERRLNAAEFHIPIFFLDFGRAGRPGVLRVGQRDGQRLQDAAGKLRRLPGVNVGKVFFFVTDPSDK